MFRKEMDKLGKKLRVVERECADWREKFDASNEQVRHLLRNICHAGLNYKFWRISPNRGIN